MGKVDDARNSRIAHTVVRFASAVASSFIAKSCPQELRRNQAEERQKRFRLTSTDSMAEEGAFLRNTSNTT
jgi:hypothetical protein